MESLTEPASQQPEIVTASELAASKAPPVPGIFASQIDMPRGLPGFPNAGRFMLEPLGDASAQLLRLKSLDIDDLAFLVLPIPENMPVIAAHDFTAACESQEFASENVIVFLIVTLEQTPQGIRLFANLRAPLLIETARKQGAQVVLQSPGYPLRYALQAG